MKILLRLCTDQFFDQLENQFEDQLWDQLEDQFEDQLWVQFEDHLAWRLRDQLREIELA